jgi:hypothetical protein
MVNEHYLQCLVEHFFIICGFSLWLSFVCGLPAPIRLASRSWGMEVGLETHSIRSTHLAGGKSIIFRAAGFGSVPGTGCWSSE